jgi:hypothetical protein
MKNAVKITVLASNKAVFIQVGKYWPFRRMIRFDITDGKSCSELDTLISTLQKARVRAFSKFNPKKK